MVTPNDLAGLTLGEAFRRWVLNDPEVISQKRAMPYASELFDKGQYPSDPSFLWPLDLEAAQLASDFVNPGYWISGQPLPEPTPAHLKAAQTIASRWSALCALLKGGTLIGSGCYVATGREETVGRAQWSRPSMFIDVQNSDLVEGPRHQPMVRWTGITISTRQAESAKSGILAPTRATIRVVTTIAACNACKEWLVGLMQTSPSERLVNKAHWWREAQGKWPGSLSRYAFDRIWAEAVIAALAPAWSAAGAPKKSSGRNRHDE
jgi:hypothetical protein